LCLSTLIACIIMPLCTATHDGESLSLQCTSPLGFDFLQYPDCSSEDSCVLVDLNIGQEMTSKAIIDQTLHEHKCVILAQSKVYEIPSNIFLTMHSNVAHLYAKNVDIQELKRTPFIFPRMESVTLSGNKIKALKEAIFYDPPRRLQKLDLSHNELASFSSNAFDKLMALKELHLNNNQITSVPFQLFQSLNSLLYLNLRNNRLGPSLKFGIFPQFLTTIDLSFNNVDIHYKFKIFAMLDDLQTLLLHGNKIQNIDNSIFMGNLKFLGISENLFSCSTLADIFLLMRHYNVTSAPEFKVFNTSNIRGIKCVE